MLAKRFTVGRPPKPPLKNHWDGSSIGRGLRSCSRRDAIFHLISSSPIPALRDLLASKASEPLPPRKKILRARERHLLLYLQRICGKNDTLSEFGPESWGTVDPATEGVKFDPQPGSRDAKHFWNAGPRTVLLQPSMPIRRRARRLRRAFTQPVAWNKTILFSPRQVKQFRSTPRPSRFSTAVMGRVLLIR